ncbi:MAG TPA: hypothetical protein VHR66_28455 [Gemmataceae bacterium]|jgi:hypothetical protein|nr:hypothetical protein [Gemmataceae bacterium]
MLTRSMLIFAALLFAGSALAAPQLKPEKDKEAPAIVGSRWSGKTAEGWDMTIDFNTNGKMTVAYNGTSFNKASWRQEGDKIYYEMNERYCEFDGKLVGDTITGSTHNVAGKIWQTRLTRVAER